MDLFWLIGVFIFGTIIGSFLNVVIYRMHTGKSLNGRSHCMSCGHTLRWFELLPVVSYLAQSARCRCCASWIPSRYVVVEVLMGVLYALLWSAFGASITLFGFYAIVTALLAVVTVYDVRHTIIPDEYVVALTVLATGFVGYEYFVTKSWMVVLMALIGGVFGFLFFAFFWFVSKGGWMGLGDAKLAFPLGLMVGFPAVYTMVVIAFVIGALISMVLLGVQLLIKRGKTALLYSSAALTMKSEIPFAPFLIIGFLLTHFFHADVFTITSALLPF